MGNRECTKEASSLPRLLWPSHSRSALSTCPSPTACADGEKNRPRVSSEQLGDSKANDLYLACLGRRRRDC